MGGQLLYEAAVEPGIYCVVSLAGQCSEVGVSGSPSFFSRSVTSDVFHSALLLYPPRSGYIWHDVGCLMPS